MRIRTRTTPFASLTFIGIGVVGFAAMAAMNGLVSSSGIEGAGVPWAFFLLPLLPIVIGVVTLLVPGGVTTGELEIETDATTRHCPACGAGSAASDRFCRSCGSALPA